ncbi:MAG: hypothetical protein R6U89_04800 [Dehalococcoidia bacterium]
MPKDYHKAFEKITRPEEEEGKEETRADLLRKYLKAAEETVPRIHSGCKSMAGKKGWKFDKWKYATWVDDNTYQVSCGAVIGVDSGGNKVKVDIRLSFPSSSSNSTEKGYVELRSEKSTVPNKAILIRDFSEDFLEKSLPWFFK